MLTLTRQRDSPKKGEEVSTEQSRGEAIFDCGNDIHQLCHSILDVKKYMFS
jgi:hypothetical protein